jgi:hypothetical protein
MDLRTMHSGQQCQRPRLRSLQHRPTPLLLVRGILIRGIRIVILIINGLIISHLIISGLLISGRIIRVDGFFEFAAAASGVCGGIRRGQRPGGRLRHGALSGAASRHLCPTPIHSSPQYYCCNNFYCKSDDTRCCACGGQGGGPFVVGFWFRVERSLRSYGSSSARAGQSSRHYTSWCLRATPALSSPTRAPLCRRGRSRCRFQSRWRQLQSRF